MTEFTFTCTHRVTRRVTVLVYVNNTKSGARSRCTKALKELFGRPDLFEISVEAK